MSKTAHFSARSNFWRVSNKRVRVQSPNVKPKSVHTMMLRIISITVLMGMTLYLGGASAEPSKQASMARHTFLRVARISVEIRATTPQSNSHLEREKHQSKKKRSAVSFGRPLRMSIIASVLAVSQFARLRKKPR